MRGLRMRGRHACAQQASWVRAMWEASRHLAHSPPRLPAPPALHAGGAVARPLSCLPNGTPANKLPPEPQHARCPAAPHALRAWAGRCWRGCSPSSAACATPTGRPTCGRCTPRRTRRSPPRCRSWAAPRTCRPGTSQACPHASNPAPPVTHAQHSVPRMDVDKHPCMSLASRAERCARRRTRRPASWRRHPPPPPRFTPSSSPHCRQAATSV